MSSVTQIMVGKYRMGIMDLHEALVEAVLNRKEGNGKAVTERLIRRLSRKNYVAPNLKAAFEAAILNEYEKICDAYEANPDIINKRRTAMDIKVLGPGCPKCEQTAKNVEEAIAEAGVSASVEKIKDVMQIAKYGVFGTPAVIIDGDVKCVGKIPSRDEIKSWIG